MECPYRNNCKNCGDMRALKIFKSGGASNENQKILKGWTKEWLIVKDVGNIVQTTIHIARNVIICLVNHLEWRLREGTNVESVV